MKNKLIIALFFIILFSGCDKKENEITQNNIASGYNAEANQIETSNLPDLNITMYVNAPRGLNVRNLPHTNGEIIALLHDTAEVTVKKEDEYEYQIDGIIGKWAYVETGNVSGWVFGGYLSSFKINRGPIFKNIAEAYNYIYGDLGYTLIMDGLTFEEYIESSNIPVYGIQKKRSFNERHQGNPVIEYLIYSGDGAQLLVWNIDSIKKNLLVSLHIDIYNNYLYNFPHYTIDEFLNDKNFGRVYDSDHNSITYSDFDPNLIALTFLDGWLYELVFSSYAD